MLKVYGNQHFLPQTCILLLKVCSVHFSTLCFGQNDDDDDDYDDDGDDDDGGNDKDDNYKEDDDNI